MMYEKNSGSLMPFDFKQISDHVPEINRLNHEITIHSFEPLIDSSNIEALHWKQMAELIEDNYMKYDGFVILHGTDTMAYTASALSFMLENLSKPVILTGSQLPIGEIRTDAKENLLTAIEIAASQKDGKALVPEVGIYFDYRLFRGNRASKINSSKFNAFQSLNYPPLAEAGVQLKFNEALIKKSTGKDLIIASNLETGIGIIKIFPGISEEWISALFNAQGIKAIILETFGSGNAPVRQWLTGALENAASKGIIILNVSQCGGGSVEQGRYETSVHLERSGVISGYDITAEAALGKLMFLLGKYEDMQRVKKLLHTSLAGEITL